MYKEKRAIKNISLPEKYIRMSDNWVNFHFGASLILEQGLNKIKNT